MVGGYYTFDFGDEPLNIGSSNFVKHFSDDSSVFARRDKPIRIKIALRFPDRVLHILADSAVAEVAGTLYHTITTIDFDNDSLISVVFNTDSDSYVFVSVIGQV